MLASYLTHWSLWRDALPVPLFAALVAFVIALAVTRQRNQLRSVFGVVFSLTLFGLVMGVLTGLSREPAVGAVLPGVLGLIGGVVVYLTGTKEGRAQVLVAALVVGFSFNLLIGAYWGSHLRIQFDEDRNTLDSQLAEAAAEQVVRLQKLLYEKQIRDIRAEWKMPNADSEHPKLKVLLSEQER